MNWVLGNLVREYILQLLVGPSLASKSQLVWLNAVKVLVSEIWFERSQRVFHDTSKDWSDR